MTDSATEKIQRNPVYQELRRKRNRLGFVLTLLMLVVYYGYVALIAFDKELLAQPLNSTGVTTLGIPIALFVIVFTVAITNGAIQWPLTSSWAGRIRSSCAGPCR